jgi:hypothetical protein
MGIKGFSKTFTPKLIKHKDLKGLTGAFDASVIMFQGCLGMSSVNGLTDSHGNPTVHINVIIARIINFIKDSIGQVWVFDYHEHAYTPPHKQLELEKRHKRRAEASRKLEDLRNKNNLFSESDEDTETKINQQEKITFSINERIINDCKFILDCFDIKWCVAPKGIEAEAVCAELTITDELDFNCDFVYTTDVDALLYGAKKVVRSIKSGPKKVIQLYDIDDLLDINNIEMKDLIKIGLMLGSDHAPKTPNIGPKTVLKKYKEIELTPDQKKAVSVFTKHIDIETIKINNTHEPGADIIKLKALLDWLEAKNFNRERIRQQLLKINKDI